VWLLYYTEIFVLRQLAASKKDEVSVRKETSNTLGASRKAAPFDDRSNSVLTGVISNELLSRECKFRVYFANPFQLPKPGTRVPGFNIT